MERKPALHLWDYAFEAFSRSDVEENLARSCGKRHSVDQFSFDTIITFQVIFQRLHSQPGIIRMIMKGRSPIWRHVSRTHRVELDLLCARINLNSSNFH